MNSDLRYNIRVMMIGPGEGIIGGISTLIETIVPPLNQLVILDYFPTVSNRPDKKSGRMSIQNIQIAISQFDRFLKAAKKFHPQIIHIHTSQGIAWIKDTFYIWAAKSMKSKVVIHFHAADFSELYSKHSKVMQAYTRFSLAHVDAVISVSERWKTSLATIVPEQKINAFKNCINSAVKCSPHPVFRKESFGLFVGSIGSRKGAFDIIEAIKLIGVDHPMFKIWLAGYEENEGDLQAARNRVKELGIEDRCELVGVITGEKKITLLEKMDFFILPSYNEGLPMAILEAMAIGKAIVSTPVGGIPEVVREGINGFLVLPGDIQAIAEKIEILVDHPEICNAMGQQSLQIAENELNVKTYIDRLVKLYQNLVIDASIEK